MKSPKFFNVLENFIDVSCIMSLYAISLVCYIYIYF